MADTSSPSSIAEAARLIRAAESILFVTGAGISADSGLPTYRGLSGLYDRGVTEDGVRIEEALSGAMFRSRPALTWKYLLEIARACRGAQPNEAHRAIAELERTKRRVVVLTQNVDGLHRAAGSADPIEIHGTLHELRCTACARGRRVDLDDDLPIPPCCPACGGAERPNVVLFGELLPDEPLNRLRAELARGFDLVVSIGTTSVFPYIAAPVELAAAAGRPTIEINPGRSEVSDLVSLRLAMGAAEAFERMRACARRGHDDDGPT